MIGQYDNFLIIGQRESKHFLFLYFLLLILQLIFDCLAYITMEKIESDGYMHFVASIIMRFINIMVLYLYQLNQYEIKLALMPIIICLIIWIIPNFIYFTKRKSVF